MILLARPLSVEIVAYLGHVAARCWRHILVACVIVEASVPDADTATGPAHSYCEQFLRICAAERLAAIGTRGGA